MAKTQVICSAGVVTTFDTPVKTFNKNFSDDRKFLIDDNDWYINKTAMISWTQVEDAEDRGNFNAL